MKKLIGLLLALCLIIGLLPMTALAAIDANDPGKYGDWAKLRFMGKTDIVVSKGAAPQYLTTTSDGEVKPCKESDNWTIKLYYEQDWVVMVLKGATIGKYDMEAGKFTKEYMGTNHAVMAAMLTQPKPSFQWKVVIEEDSYIAAGYGGIFAHGNAPGSDNGPWATNMIIESKDNAKLTMISTGSYPAIMGAAWAASDYTLTFENANLDITTTTDYKNSNAIQGCHVIINGGSLNLNSVNSAIRATKTLTVNGGNHTFTASNGAVACPVEAIDGEVTINSGNVKMFKTEEGGGGLVKTGKFVINGGNVYGEGYNYAINADTVEINAGVVELQAISEEGDAQVFINGAPDLATYQNFAAVLGYDKNDVAKYDPDDAMNMDTRYFKVAKAGTADAPVVPEKPEPTEPPATEPPATEPPATEPPATEPPATEPPATSGNNNSGNNDNNGGNTEDNKTPDATKKPAGNNNNTSGSSVDEDIVILWIVVGIVFVSVCTGTILILLKRKAAMAAAAPAETEEATEDTTE